MKKTLRYGLLLAGLLLLSACWSAPKDRELVIFVVDLTGSVKEDAQAEALDAIRSAIEHQLQRGDGLVVIPITDDSLTEAQGQILRFHLAEHREAYDQDIRQLVKDVRQKLQNMQEIARTRPILRSDILGAVKLAEEELDASKWASIRKLVVLSDFIHDDAQYDFKRDIRLQNEQSAKELARDLSRERVLSLQNTTVYMGLLRSSDLKNLPAAKRSAIQSFWAEYFRDRGAADVLYATDGSGNLAAFLKER